VPQLPVENLRAAPVAALLAVSGALLVAGFVGFRRRDVG
jgi:putative exporter of polyketide antibiotics